MAIGTLLGGLFKSGAEKLVEATGTALDKVFTNKEELATAKIDMEKVVSAHMEEMAKLSQSELEAYLKDMDSARNMQIEALKQGDVFSKRFIYYLAAFVITIVCLFDFCLFMVNYPDKNRDLINMVAGILNSTALVMVLSFFFGSSKGSKDGAERMDKMIDKMK